MEEWADYGDIVRLEFPIQSMYLVTAPDLIEEVLVADPEKYERGELVRQSFGPLEENALSVAEGDQWRRLRSAFQPAFTRDRVHNYADLVVDYVSRWLTELEDGTVVDIELETRRLTLQILAEALFGIDIRDEGEAVRQIARSISVRSDFTNLTPYLPSWAPTPSNIRFRRAMGQLREQIATRIKHRRETNTGEDDFLSMLVSMQAEGDCHLSDAEIRDNVIGFLWAGQDTTSLALTYTLYLLATHPEKRERLESELATVLDGEPPTADDLSALTYAEKVITEALRLYPPAPTTPREPTEDVVLGNYRVPADSMLVLPQWAVHRDSQWYESPGSFRPERWTDAFEDSLPEYAYFPFGGGPRHCIGMRFALTELKLAVARISQRCRFESLVDSPLEFSLAATLKPTSEMKMRIQRRA